MFEVIITLRKLMKLTDKNEKMAPSRLRRGGPCLRPHTTIRPWLLTIIVLIFLVNSLGPLPVYAQELSLPMPGTMVNLSPGFEPVLLKGLGVHPENPFLFDFIIDTGNSHLYAANLPLKEESKRLIKYFLTAMTVPEKDLWVNLSPFEKNRMIKPNLGETEMGRDMLAQDYILKQLTASLIYPEKNLGKAFWDKVYAKTREYYGTTQLPFNMFNKVWIIADRAEVFEHGQTAYIVGAHLKVMLEEDYLSMQKHGVNGEWSRAKYHNPSLIIRHQLSSRIIKSIILPELEKEVNAGKNFAPLRQIFYSMVLASWYKMALKDAILTQIYGNKSKVKRGVNQEDIRTNDQIFNRYIQAYKKGVFNYIKEEKTSDPAGSRTIERKYFSGGENLAMLGNRNFLHRITDTAQLLKNPFIPQGHLIDEVIILSPARAKTKFGHTDSAMSQGAKENGRQMFNLEKTIQFIVEGFLKDKTAVKFPTLKEFSNFFGLGQMTFSNYFPDILKELQNRITRGDFDQDSDLKARLSKACESKIEQEKKFAVRKKPKPQQWFDLEKTIDFIVAYFQNDNTVCKLPNQKKLSKGLGPTQPVFSVHYPEIIAGLQSRLDRGDYDQDPGLKERLTQALIDYAMTTPEVPDAAGKEVKTKKEYQRFDLEKTIEFIIGQFRKNKILEQLPNQYELADNFKSGQTLFRTHYRDITTELQLRIKRGDYDQDIDIKTRLSKALERKIIEMGKRKPKKNFDLNKTVGLIEEKFRADKKLVRWPLVQGLCDSLEITPMTLSRHLMEVLLALQTRLVRGDYDREPDLKKRLIKVLKYKMENRRNSKDTGPVQQEQKRQVFDLEATIKFILKEFRDNKQLNQLPNVRKLSMNLGLSHQTYANHYPEIIEKLGTSLRRGDYDQDPDLKKRLELALKNKMTEQENKEPRKQSSYFQLEEAVDYIVQKFRTSHELVKFPTNQELSDKLGALAVTYSVHKKEIIDEIQNKIIKGEFDKEPDLKSRLSKALEDKIQKAKDRKPVEEFKKFDLAKTIEFIVGLFRGNAKIHRLPSYRKLSDGLEANYWAFGYHSEEIITELQTRITRGDYDQDQDLKERLSQAVKIKKKHFQNRKIPQSRQEFDLDQTIVSITEGFRYDLQKIKLPSQLQLSNSLGPSRTTFGAHYQEILQQLQIRLERGDYNQETGLKKRLIQALAAKRTELANQKKRSMPQELNLFDLDDSIDFIIKEFLYNSKIKRLPTQKKLSQKFGLSQQCIWIHFPEIVNELKKGWDGEIMTVTLN